MFTMTPAMLALLWMGGAPVVRTPTTSPAPAAEPEAQLEQCMKHCRDTFTAIEDTLRLIERAQAGQDASLLHAALRQVRSELIVIRQQMSECLHDLERVRSPGGVVFRSAAVSGTWSCPMHNQIHQDSPGNCPVCDATLRPSTFRAGPTQ